MKQKALEMKEIAIKDGELIVNNSLSEGNLSEKNNGLNYILLTLTNLIIFKINILEEEVSNFIDTGPTNEASDSNKDVLLNAYNALIYNEIKELIGKDHDDLGISKLQDTIGYAISDTVIEIMSSLIEKMLRKNKKEFEEDELLSAVHGLEGERNFEEVTEKIKLEELMLVQFFNIRLNGTYDQPVSHVFSDDEEAARFINEYKENNRDVRFIKTYRKDNAIHEFIPERIELASCLKLAFLHDDMNFIKLCIDNDKLHPGILNNLEYPEDFLYETFSKGRFDLLDIIIRYKLFGFGAEEMREIDRPTEDNGTTRLMNYCKLGNVTAVKKLIAMGADPTLTDKNGRNALMHTVTYSDEDLLQLNLPNGLQSDHIKNLKKIKNEIIDILLKDKRINLNAVDNVDHENAISICVRQGTVKTDHLIELRGDHDLMNKLSDAGSDPLFGELSYGYRLQTYMTFFTAGILKAIKSIINLHYIGKVIFYPIECISDYAIFSIVAYKGYLDAKQPFYKACRTSLDSEYANDTLINLNKKIMIGAFHIRGNGTIIYGDELKKYITRYYRSYTYAESAYYKQSDLPDQSRMSIKEKLQARESLFNRYYTMKNVRVNLPWTKNKLEDISKEMESTYDHISVGYKITEEFTEQLESTFKKENHAIIKTELFDSPRFRSLFYRIHTLVKSGTLNVSLECRYNLMKFEETIHSVNLKVLTTFDAYKIAPGCDLVFSKFADFCNSLKFENDESELCFKDIIRIINIEFRKDLNLDREQKTFIDLISGATDYLGRNILKLGVGSISLLSGYSDAEIYDFTADNLSVFGAVCNIEMHYGFIRLSNRSTLSFIIPFLGCLNEYLKNFSDINEYLYDKLSSVAANIKELFHGIVVFINDVISYVINSYCRLDDGVKVDVTRISVL
jgi:hypothetical protein